VVELRANYESITRKSLATFTVTMDSRSKAKRFKCTTKYSGMSTRQLTTDVGVLYSK